MWYPKSIKIAQKVPPRGAKARVKKLPPRVDAIVRVFFFLVAQEKRENAQCKASVSLDLDGSGCRVDVQSRVSVLNSLRREQGAERDGDEDREKKKRKKKKKKKE